MGKVGHLKGFIFLCVCVLVCVHVGDISSISMLRQHLGLSKSKTHTLIVNISRTALLKASQIWKSEAIPLLIGITYMHASFIHKFPST